MKKIQIVTRDFKKIISTGIFNNLYLGNNENIMVNEIQKLDSVHDFGGTRGNNLATDALSKKRDDNATFFYDQMRLFFIQKYSFDNPILNILPIPIQNFSNFSYPGVGQLQRIVDDVENYCFLLAMKESLETGMVFDINFSFQDMPNTKDITRLKNIKNNIYDFFQDHIDVYGTGKINFIVDTPGDVTKILKSDHTDETNNFAYIFTQESAHDSAKGKPTTLEPQVINDAYQGNGFCEAFMPNDKQSRTYAIGSSLGQFESNFRITLDGMNYNASGKEYFNTSVKYSKNSYGNQFDKQFDCILNSLIHPTNVPQITKEVNKFTKDSSLRLRPETKNVLVPSNNIDGFYSDFASKGYDYPNDNKNNLDFNFTKKRAGDGLQAKIAQLINSESFEGLKCYKLYDKYSVGGITSVLNPFTNIKGGVDTNNIFTIRKIILVTIDRVLFSYCVKNKIPAIYSGTNCILLFNPRNQTIPSIASQSLISRPISIPNTSTNTTNYNTRKEQINIYQKGGSAKEIADIFAEIPFSLFKIIPRIFFSLTTLYNWNKFRKQQTYILDDDLITHSGNSKNCIYYKDFISPQGYNILNDDYKIWLNDAGDPDEKHLINIYKPASDENIFRIETYKYKLNREYFTLQDIMNIIIMPFWNPINRVTRSRFIENFDKDAIRDYLTELHNESTQSAGAIGDNNSPENLLIQNNPKLNVYLKFFYNNNISLDENKLTTNNFIALTSYLCIFDSYEINMCFDNDKYDQDFIKISDTLPEVSNKISMYLFFKFLLEDFPTQHDKICYGLMEYFINDGDINKDYFDIADDLQTQIYYIYCDEIVRPIYVNELIVKNISDGVINVENPIFINTKTYFEQLRNRVNDKTNEIKSYLNHPNREVNVQDNIELEEYIKTYFNMYGFMNMTSEFMDSVFEPDPESTSESFDETTGIAKGIPGLSSEERLKRIQEQQARYASRSPTDSITTKSQLSPFDPSRQKTALDVAAFSDGDISNMVTSNFSSNIGNRRGGKTKKYRKSRRNLKSNKNKKRYKKSKNITRRNRKKKRNKNSRRK
jgi:hypothetical protein